MVRLAILVLKDDPSELIIRELLKTNGGGNNYSYLWRGILEAYKKGKIRIV